MRAQWHPQLGAWIADMKAANGTFLVFGAFQDMDRHRVFVPASDGIEFDRAVGAEMDTFDQPALPASTEDHTAQDLGLSLWKEDDISPGGRQSYSFYYGVGYMPPGEAVDWRTNRPLSSTASEPATGAWNAMGLLSYLDQFDPRLPPLE